MRAVPWSVGAVWAACMLAWLLGVGLQLHRPSLGSVVQDASVGSLALVLAWVAWVWPATWPAAVSRVCWCLMWGLLGWSVANVHAHALLAQNLPSALEGRDIELSGIVATLPSRSPQGQHFLLEIDQPSRDQLQALMHQVAPGVRKQPPQRLALNWYHRVPWATAQTALPLPLVVRAGERWQLTVRLQQPHAVFNPHSFDRELSLFEQGVRATGSVRRGRRLQVEAGYPVQRWRQTVRDRIQATVPDPQVAGVLAALALGDQAAIERGEWELFQVTGVAHLMSISGLHVTMFAWLSAAVLGRLWRCSQRAMYWCPAHSVARWGGFAAALGYAAFAGWGVPAQRTVWMLAVVTVLTSSDRRWPWPWVLLCAAVLVTLLDPWALLQAGFWLSFMAVALLLMNTHPQGPVIAASGSTQASGALMAWRQRARRWVHSWCSAARTQWVISWGLTPVTVVFFQQVSVVGFVANLVAIPVVTFLITPLALLGVIAPECWLWGAWCVEQLTHYLTWLSRWPAGVWAAAVAPWWAQFSGLVAGALWMMNLPWEVRALSAPLLLPLLWPVMPTPQHGEFEVLVIDVGQGTAVGVQTAQHWLLFDTGPRYSAVNDAGRRVLLPLMQASGHKKIDRLMISHRDADHVGGAVSVLQKHAVGSLWSSMEAGHPVTELAKTLGVDVQSCQAGVSWQWDGVTFDVLHPQPKHYAQTLPPNAKSCVLRVSAGNASMLLTGDIEKAQEAALVAERGQALESAALLVPHHGSNTSSTPAFLDAVQPQVALVQAGYRNRFGHPSPKVMKRYEALGIKVHTSAHCGAWRWRSSEPVLGAQCEREVRRRYWHWQAEARSVPAQ